MPFGLQPVCSVCGSQESQMWSKSSDGSIKCNDCNNNETKVDETSNHSKTDKNVDSVADNNNDNNSNANDNKSDKTNAAKQPMVAIRKSVRNKGKIRTTFSSKLNSIKGKSRRIVLKRCVVRGPTAFATPVTSDYIFFKGQYFQVGDIVSMEDMSGDTYYAQIRGFLQDQYCEKSAVITWLLPSKESPTDHFDPSTYFLGPEEDIPRKMECMHFICHAPSDYYRDPYSPYPTLTMKVESGFIWTRIGPQIVKLSNKNKIIESEFTEQIDD